MPTSKWNSEPPQDGMALCLSGGGFRAMLFHLGSLWRLNELGQLPKLDRVSSVSGGSIVAGMLGLAWSKLAFDSSGVAAAFDAQVVQPIRALASKTIDIGSVFSGLLSGSVSDKIAGAYRTNLYGDGALADLPEHPRFIINATNVQSKALWRFSHDTMGDYRVGMTAHPEVELALAVAASSAFPPFLSPVELKVAGSSVLLCDGGVYDNLGLEPAWKYCRTVLVSDGAMALAAESNPSRDWARQTYRVLGLIDNQVLMLRKRELIGSFVDGSRLGAYWGIGSNIANYGLADAVPFPLDKSTPLAETPTRLAAIAPERQEQLVNWGYAICDTALRSHLDKSFPKPARLPY